MIEVEVKARIDSFEEMEKRLKDLGAVKTKDEFQEDIYFASPIVDFAETDEALRIRTTNNDTFITYKGPKLNEKAKTRKEVEMTIESAAKASDIFTEIGFTPARTVRKSRQYYRYENFEISLDDVEGLPPYMEIEIALSDSEDYTEAQNRIFKLFEKLDITDGFERTSYMELIMNSNKYYILIIFYRVIFCNILLVIITKNANLHSPKTLPYMIQHSGTASRLQECASVSRTRWK